MQEQKLFGRVSYRVRQMGFNLQESRSISPARALTATCTPMKLEEKPANIPEETLKDSAAVSFSLTQVAQAVEDSISKTMTSLGIG